MSLCFPVNDGDIQLLLINVSGQEDFKSSHTVALCPGVVQAETCSRWPMDASSAVLRPRRPPSCCSLGARGQRTRCLWGPEGPCLHRPEKQGPCGLALACLSSPTLGASSSRLLLCPVGAHSRRHTPCARLGVSA